jgi:TRAP-type mannitol/chloroaromatic compound transport system substrate-binding protein
VNAPALRRLIVNGAILKGFAQEVLEACYTTANEIYAECMRA